MTYNIDKEKWKSFSKEAQLKNIAAELSRMTSAGLRAFERTYKDMQKQACERAIIMIDASLEDAKWKNKKELYQLRDAVSALYINENDPSLSRLATSYAINVAGHTE